MASKLATLTSTSLGVLLAFGSPGLGARAQTAPAATAATQDSGTLQLRVGDDAYAVIKSSDVMVGK